MKCSWLKDAIFCEIYPNSFKDGTNEINDKIVLYGDKR